MRACKICAVEIPSPRHYCDSCRSEHKNAADRRYRATKKAVTACKPYPGATGDYRPIPAIVAEARGRGTSYGLRMAEIREGQYA